MKALIDADLLRFEIGFGAETMWRGVTEGDVQTSAPWYMVSDLLDARIEEILRATKADDYQLYLTEGETFRYDLAKTKPYKGTRKENKPWHFANLTSHMVHVLAARSVTNIEADDRLAIDHLDHATEPSILCSRDKDLRQVPGYLYSWELGRQPSFGPTNISEIGDIELIRSSSGPKIRGTGLKFFWSQVLTGDDTDNVPGLKGCGPVAAYDLIGELDNPEELEERVQDAYQDDVYFLEQAQLCWIIRRLNPDGTPELWRPGLWK